MADGGEPHGYDECTESADALVMGYKYLRNSPFVSGWHYGEKPVFVLSPSGRVQSEICGLDLTNPVFASILLRDKRDLGCSVVFVMLQKHLRRETREPGNSGQF